jgi:hypothetical protein
MIGRMIALHTSPNAEKPPNTGSILTYGYDTTNARDVPNLLVERITLRRISDLNGQLFTERPERGFDLIESGVVR